MAISSYRLLSQLLGDTIFELAKLDEVDNPGHVTSCWNFDTICHTEIYAFLVL